MAPLEKFNRVPQTKNREEGLSEHTGDEYYREKIIMELILEACKNHMEKQANIEKKN